MSLLFDVIDLRQEIHAFRELARTFLAPGSDAVLRQAEQDLVGITRGVGGPFAWQLHPHNPMLTKLSYGSYMPGDEGSLCVHAKVTFIWHLEPVRPRGDSRPARQVRLSGLASTVVRIIEGDPGGDELVELAVWRMEVADDAAPGAYFHVQVLGRDQDEMFPKALDIPRLPGVLASPLSCMEFAISELFQDDWARHAVRETGPGRRWRSVQAFRHDKQLRWHAEQVAASSGSPWVAWKRAIPPEHLFLTR